MMKGYLDSQTSGHCVAAEGRVASSLKRVSTEEVLAERAYGPRRMENPSVYSADYFGEKWHIDQVWSSSLAVMRKQIYISFNVLSNIKLIALIFRLT